MSRRIKKNWKAKYNITRSQVITDDDLALARLFYDTKVNDYVFCLKNLYKKNIIIILIVFDIMICIRHN